MAVEYDIEMGLPPDQTAAAPDEPQHSPHQHQPQQHLDPQADVRQQDGLSSLAAAQSPILGASAAVVAASAENCNECTICLCEFEEGEVIKRLPICLHAYHASCIDVWLRKSATCPLCKHSLW